MNNRILESERLFLKALSFEELLLIDNGEYEKIKPGIEKCAITSSVELAVFKKLEKMRKVDKDVHDWFTYWLIISKENSGGIGFIGFKGTPNTNGHCEVGYSITKEYRKQGLMTEALNLLTKWASKCPSCKAITAIKVPGTNIGSNKVLSNCKFVLLSCSHEYNDYIYYLDRIEPHNG